MFGFRTRTALEFGRITPRPCSKFLKPLPENVHMFGYRTRILTGAGYAQSDVILRFVIHYLKTYTSSDYEHVSPENPAGLRRSPVLIFLNNFLKTYTCSVSERMSPRRRVHPGLTFFNHCLKTYSYSDCEHMIPCMLAMSQSPSILTFVNHLGKTYISSDCGCISPKPRPPRPAQRLRPSPP